MPFVFPPLVLAIYFFAPRGARNAVLLSGSILFYAWSKKQFVLVLIASVLLNYFSLEA